MRERLARLAPDACFASPMARTTETARLALGESATPPELLDDLREVDFGAWECLTYDDLLQRDPDGAKRWCHAGSDFQFPDGDSVADFRRRVGKCIYPFLSTNIERPVLSDELRTRLADYFKDDVEQFREFCGRDFAEWSV